MTTTNPPKKNYYPGLDYLRIAAIVMVTIQHVFSMINHYEWTTFHGISIGQLGVGLFCSISGFLAFANHKPPVSWLWERLFKLFPTYWLAMLFSFLVTWLAHVKTISMGLFVSQMFGIGFFTHGWNLVNIVSWFVSLILLCYGLAFVAKLSKHESLFLMTISVISVIILLNRWEVDLSRHIIAFAIGGIFAQSGKNLINKTFFWLALATLSVGALGDVQLSYSSLTLIALPLGISIHAVAGNLTRIVAQNIYEYFLLHGIFLNGAIRFFPGPELLKVIVGICMSLAAAILLKMTVALLMKSKRRHALQQT